MTPELPSSDEVFQALLDLGILPTPTVSHTLEWHLMHDTPVVGASELPALFAGFVHDGSAWRHDVRLGRFDSQGRRHVPAGKGDREASWIWWAAWNGVPELTSSVTALPRE